MFYAHGKDKLATEKRIVLWQMIHERSGKKPQALIDMPEISVAGNVLWQLYLDIKKGCEAVGYMEIQAYKNVTSCTLSPWEASLMVSIDRERLNG